MLPSCLSTMMDRAMASPWPVPFPISLVVKKGSNIFSLTSRGIPVPVSPIRISTPVGHRPVSTVILPFFSFPSLALADRMGRVHDEVEDHLVELSGQARDRRQRTFKPGFHIGDILPLILGYRNRALN